MKLDRMDAYTRLCTYSDERQDLSYSFLAIPLLRVNAQCSRRRLIDGANDQVGKRGTPVIDMPF